MLIISNILKTIFFIITLIIFISAKLAYFGGEDQKTWKPVQAAVLKSELGIEKLSKTVEKDNFMNQDTYFWDVKYKYNYQGLDFEREGIYVNLKSTSDEKSEYQIQVKQYPRGSEITVYVNPESPDEAYLIRRTEGAIESTYKFAKYLMYFAIFLFFTPLIWKLPGKMKQKNNPQGGKTQAPVQPQPRQNYSRPAQDSRSKLSNQEETKPSDYSDDGFDV
ncbi:MAG: DUF3592 domain-containing protein [Proteobacteria bacterium]|nr:DUF3592 domain-containing protein [Pseudomonadota bacterium]